MIIKYVEHIVFRVNEQDSHGGYDKNLKTYTIPVPGIYVIVTENEITNEFKKPGDVIKLPKTIIHEQCGHVYLRALNDVPIDKLYLGKK